MKNKFGIAFVLFVVGCSKNLSGPPVGQQPANLSEYATLQTLLPKNLGTYTTLNQLIGDLPLEYRSSYSLVRATHSLQHASDQFPRVIMGHCREDCDKPQVVIAFHGNPEGQRFNLLETVALNPAEGSLKYQAIEEVGDHLEFSSSNPPLCLSCHNQKPNLIWSPYPTWPGFYRETILGNLDPTEMAPLAQFWAHRNENPRYALLGDKSAVFLSEDPEINPNYELVKKNPHYFEIVGITRVMNTIGFYVQEAKLRAFPQYDKLKFALAGIFSNCAPESLVPPDIAVQFPHDYAYYQQYVNEARARRRPGHLQVWNYAPVVLPQMFYVLENLGEDLTHWFAEGNIPRDQRTLLMSIADNAQWGSLRLRMKDEDLAPAFGSMVDWGGGDDVEVYDCALISQRAQEGVRAVFNERATRTLVRTFPLFDALY